MDVSSGCGSGGFSLRSLLVCILVALAAFLAGRGTVRSELPRADPVPSPVPTRAVTPRPPATPTPDLSPLLSERDTAYNWPFSVPWRVDCTDGLIWNGYSKGDGQRPERFYCVPGLVSRSVQYSTGPSRYMGGVSEYHSEEAIRAQCRRQAEFRIMNCERYNGRFAATMFCGNIGRRLWVNDLGPFLVVDCSSNEDLPINILIKELGVELSPGWRDRTGSWASIRVEYGQDWLYGVPLAQWFLENVVFDYRPNVGGPPAADREAPGGR